MWYTITLIVGLVILGISLYILTGTLSFLKQSNRAVATVIELEPIRDSDGTTYKAIFKFKTYTNQEIIHRNGSSSNPPGWKVGEETTIAYDPANPSRARILTYFGTFSWTIVLMALSMPMIVVGGGFYVSRYFLR